MVIDEFLVVLSRSFKKFREGLWKWVNVFEDFVQKN